MECQVHKGIRLQGGRAGRSIDTTLLFQHDKYTIACERATSNTTNTQERTSLEGSLIFRGTEVSYQSVIYLVVNNRHVFNWATERRQLSDRLLGISYPRLGLCASSLCHVLFILRSSSHISVL